MMIRFRLKFGFVDEEADGDAHHFETTNKEEEEEECEVTTATTADA